MSQTINLSNAVELLFVVIAISLLIRYVTWKFAKYQYSKQLANRDKLEKPSLEKAMQVAKRINSKHFREGNRG